MDEFRPIKPVVKFDDVARLDLRVALVLDCHVHPNADKLLILKVDIGGETRQICSGLRHHYRPEDLIGRRVVVVANLETRSMRGEISQGMLLAASAGPMKEQVVIVIPDHDLPPGSPVG